jgi:hypothetical protein
MSYRMRITAASAYTTRHGKKTIGIYGSVFKGEELVEENVVIHLSLEGGAKPITQRDVKRLGRNPGEPLSETLTGKDAPVRPTTDEERNGIENADRWTLNFAPEVDPEIEAFLDDVSDAPAAPAETAVA